MMKKLALLACYVFMALVSLAQKSFQPGYVVSTQGDTIRGFVDYRNWDLNPKTISFKKTLTSESEAFAPQDCRGFAVADEQYVTAEVQIQEDSEPENPTPNLVKRWVFLQTIVRGQKSLYHHNGKAEGFYILDNSVFQYLEYKKYTRKFGDETKTAENRKFIGQLTLYFGDCPSVSTVLSKVKYNKKSLEAAFGEYYLCVKSLSEFKKETEKVRFQFGVLAGASMTQLNFGSSNSAFDYLTKPSYPSSTSIAGGAMLEAIFARDHGRWSINNELVYSSYSTKGKYSYTNTMGASIKEDIEIRNNQLRLNTMLRFNLPVNKIAFFANAGIGNSISIANTNERIIKSTFVATTTTKKEEALKNFKPYEFSWLAGAGIKVLNRYTFEFRHQRNFGGLSSSSSLSSAALTNYFLFGYRF